MGKTTLVRSFGESFKKAVFLNLEKRADRQYFEQFDEPKTIIDAIFLARNINTPHEDTLLFIDEIQEAPQAIQLLRYFYEELPALPVIAAGSLLEFAMRQVQSFPVGRVSFAYLHPLNFPEYLHALGHESALAQLQKVPVASFAHNILLAQFNQYTIIGGMPEVVKSNMAQKGLNQLPRLYDGLWDTYQHDVEKYAQSRSEWHVIRHIMGQAHLYVDQRIRFQGFGNSNYRSREVGEAMRSLNDARVIRLIYPTTDLAPPVKPDLKKSPRLQFLDTGILNHALGIQPQLLGMANLTQAYKGAIIPHVVTQELISLQNESHKPPLFWVREKSGASSEVDLVYAHGELLVPLEIKSGSSGSLKSLHQFVDRAPHSYAVRIYGGEFSVLETKTPAGKPYFLMNLPYYLATQLPAYLDWFMEECKV